MIPPIRETFLINLGQARRQMNARGKAALAAGDALTARSYEVRIAVADRMIRRGSAEGGSGPG